MDYKYIEQLMERYFQCETSLQEEQILRSFFQQEDIPTELFPYRDLFLYEEREITMNKLGDEFDARILSITEEPVVKARRVSLKKRLNPFFKAAAIVAIILTVGNAAQHSFEVPESPGIQEGYVKPDMGYQQPSLPSEMMTEGLTPAADPVSIGDTLAALISSTEEQ